MDHLLDNSYLLVSHGIESGSLKVILDDREATFDRVILRRVSHVEYPSDLVFGHDLLDAVWLMERSLIHK
jgi:hypothetical protein